MHGEKKTNLFLNCASASVISIFVAAVSNKKFCWFFACNSACSFALVAFTSAFFTSFLSFVSSDVISAHSASASETAIFDSVSVFSTSSLQVL